MHARRRLIIACIALTLAFLLLWKHSDGEAVRTRAASRGGAGDSAGEPREDAPWWSALHELFVQEVAAADEKKGFKLIFYGDSITEAWRGTSAGQHQPHYAANAKAFAQHFGKPYGAAALAIAGDQTHHLQWRLQHGELPAKKLPKVAVLLIGTNDLGAARYGLNDEDEPAAIATAVPGVARAVLGTVHLIQAAAPSTQVLLLALLPRGGGRHAFALPSVFTPALEEVNMRFEHMASQDGRVHFLDCGAVLVAANGSAIEEELMPDALHPSGRGAERLALCIKPEVDRLMALK